MTTLSAASGLLAPQGIFFTVVHSVWAAKWQHRVHRRRKTKQKHNTICTGYHFTSLDTNKVNKTCTLLQTTGRNDEHNIVFMGKS